MNREEYERILEDLELLGLIKREGEMIIVDEACILSYIEKAFSTVRDFFKRTGRVDRFKELYRSNPETALYTVIGARILVDISLARMRLGVPVEDAKLFERGYVEKIIVVLMGILENTGIYWIAIDMIGELISRM